MIRVAMAQRPRHGDLVHVASQARQVLAGMNAGDAGGHRLKLATDLGRSVWFHVEGIVMRSAAGEKDDQTGACPAKVRWLRGSRAGCGGTAFEQAGQRQAKQAE